MYKLALVLSTVPSNNVFRAALTGAFRSGYFNDFLVCSGFFHERTNSKGPFYASKALHTRTLPDPSTVTVVGAYDPSATEFDDFVKNLASSLGTVAGSPVPIAQRRSLKKYANRWHAKIFIARNATHHGFAVVGSSNLTRNAFDASPSNNEADVVIWDDSNMIAQKVATEALTGRQDGAPDAAPLPNVIVGNYDPNDPRNSAPLQMNDRLSTLWQDVLSATS